MPGWTLVVALAACGGPGEATDPCAGGTGDADGDGICDALDTCPGGDDAADADGDGVCDALDRCEGANDTWDQDGNGIPDACDVVLVATAASPRLQVAADPPFRLPWSYEAEGVELGWLNLWEEGEASATWAADDEEAAPFVALLTDGVSETITLRLEELAGSLLTQVPLSEAEWNLDDPELGLPDLADFVVDHLVQVTEVGPLDGGARVVTTRLEVWGHRDPDDDRRRRP